MSFHSFTLILRTNLIFYHTVNLTFVFAREIFFQVKNDIFGEYVVKKYGKVIGPIICLVESDFGEKWFLKKSLLNEALICLVTFS